MHLHDGLLAQASNGFAQLFAATERVGRPELVFILAAALQACNSEGLIPLLWPLPHAHHGMQDTVSKPAPTSTDGAVGKSTYRNMNSSREQLGINERQCFASDERLTSACEKQDAETDDDSSDNDAPVLQKPPNRV